MNKQKSIYLGGGFRQHQLLFMMPIVASYCKSKKIKNIIIEKNLINKSLNHNLIKEIKKNFNLITLPNLLKKKKFFFLLVLNFNLAIFFFKYFFLNKKKLLERKDNWLNKQIKHSIWDFGIRINKKNLIQLEFYSKIKSIYYASKFYSYSVLLMRYYDIHTAFLQHFVYFERALFANLRKNNSKLIVKSFQVLRVQKKNEDLSANSLNNIIFKRSYNFLGRKKIEKYWKHYLKGKSTYVDARFASNLKGNIRTKKNVIFLHVFRDSPYTCIDNKRIFADYFHWFSSTLKILSKSNEFWQIRVHPSSKKWGENPQQIIDYTKNKIFGGEFPKNISFINNKLSNLKSFDKANRIVTYSGHAHLEAACFGIKPIVISRTTLSDFDKDLTLYPKDFEDYKKLLLLDSNNRKFKLKKNEIDISKRIFYLIHNCCNFTKDIKTSDIFFNQSNKKNLNNIYSSVFKNLGKSNIYLKKLGKAIGTEIQQSLNSNFIKYFKNKV